MYDKYVSVNKPEIFEFHDSFFELDSIRGNCVSVCVTGLNINRDAEQNPKKFDLEIKKARITFENISDLTYTPGRTWTTDEKGGSVPVGPEIIYKGKEAAKIIEKELCAGVEIYSHSIADGCRFVIEGCGEAPYFEIQFKARKITVEWDEYKGPAWYELTKQSKRELILDTPDGEIKTEARIIARYDGGELYAADEPEKIRPKETSVGIKHGGKEYWGNGASDRAALADLQTHLPDGTVLICRNK